MSGGNCRLCEVVEMPYWRQQSFDDSLIFAKCIDNQHFLISILHSGLLLWLEGKNAEHSAFLVSILPSPKNSANQRNSTSAFYPRPIFCDAFVHNALYTYWTPPPQFSLLCPPPCPNSKYATVSINIIFSAN